MGEKIWGVLYENGEASLTSLSLLVEKKVCVCVRHVSQCNVTFCAVVSELHNEQKHPEETWQTSKGRMSISVCIFLPQRSSYGEVEIVACGVPRYNWNSLQSTIVTVKLPYGCSF